MGLKEKYSYSKLSSFHTCPYMWEKTYIEHQKGIQNAFALYGSEVHSLMERYAKGDIKIQDLPNVYEWEFDTAIDIPFPYNKFCELKDTYYRQGLEFLKNFQGYDKYQILGVEEKFEIEIGDFIFNGIIDLIYKDESGNLIIQDYKSKKALTKVEKKEYAKQLYAYSLWAKKKYGDYPRILRFMLFRSNVTIDIPFDEADLKDAINWIEQTVEKIRNAWSYEAITNDFFCTNLCNHRLTCDMK